MLYACAPRFDVTENLKKKFGFSSEQSSLSSHTVQYSVTAGSWPSGPEAVHAK